MRVCDKREREREQRVRIFPWANGNVCSQNKWYDLFVLHFECIQIERCDYERSQQIDEKLVNSLLGLSCAYRKKNALTRREKEIEIEKKNHTRSLQIATLSLSVTFQRLLPLAIIIIVIIA